MWSPRLRSPRVPRVSGDGSAASTLDAEQRASGRPQWRPPRREGLQASQLPERRWCWRLPRRSSSTAAAAWQRTPKSHQRQTKRKASPPLVSQRDVRSRGQRFRLSVILCVAKATGCWEAWPRRVRANWPLALAQRRGPHSSKPLPPVALHILLWRCEKKFLESVCLFVSSKEEAGERA